ncbi:FAD dependent oxidoreductase [Thozetella sp. PMI_491]|nr:FAD dependent oxidoreductase [Thozetella sp. PMI_491]
MSQTDNSTKAQERLMAIANSLKAVEAVSAATQAIENPRPPFPVPNPTIPFWRTELHEIDNRRSTAELPEQCDIVIIGSGFSGASIAHHILEGNSSPPSMVILEARSACSGATGRNGGHLKPSPYYTVEKYTRMFGRQGAIDIASFECKQLDAVKELVRKEKIDCDFILTRAYDVMMDEDEDFPTVRDVWYLPAAAAEVQSGVKGAKCAFSFPVASVWPYKLVTHLLSQAEKRGVNIQTHTPVTYVTEGADADGYWTVTTPRGQLRAKKVIFATNGYTAGILPSFQDKIIPVRGICSRIMTPKGALGPSLPSSYSVRHNAKGADYHISRTDGSFIIGGGRPRYLHRAEEWYGVFDDSKLIEPAVPHFDGLMQRTFRGFEDSNASVDRIWTGIMGYTSDLMPYVGAVPSRPGQFICAGFNGHGMPNIFLASKGLAKMVLQECTFEETELPKPFKPTEARLLSTKNAVLDLLK